MVYTQARRKQVKSGEAISDILKYDNVLVKHALTRGVLEHVPPERFLNFSSSEVVSEPVSANAIASTMPWNCETTALLSFADRIFFGELEFARLVHRQKKDSSSIYGW